MSLDTSNKTINTDYPLDYSVLEDINLLYAGTESMAQGSRWKEDVQRFEYNWLSENVHLCDDIHNQTYQTLPSIPFIINERGHERLIHGLRARDRVVRHTFCDFRLNPLLRPKLIYDNYASLKLRGISMARNRFEMMLHKAWRQYGPDAWIVITDYSGFYDNILHEEIKKAIQPMLQLPLEKWMLDVMLSDSLVDVSDLTEEEYKAYRTTKLKMLDRAKIPKEKLTGEKFWHKSLNIGNQDSQSLSTYYPTPIDNFIKIVCSVNFYGRYMDDSFLIVKTKEEALRLLQAIKEKATELGIFINEKKTIICKIRHCFKFLQIHYRFTKTGHLIRKIDYKRIVAMRRRLKAQYKKVMANEIPYENIKNSFRSWMGTHYIYLSRNQMKKLAYEFDKLFYKLNQRNSIWTSIQTMVSRLKKRKRCKSMRSKQFAIIKKCNPWNGMDISTTLTPKVMNVS